MTTAPNSEEGWARAIIDARTQQERARLAYEAVKDNINGARDRLTAARHAVNVLEEQFQDWITQRVEAEIEKQAAAGCDLGVGCDEVGVCYAVAHGEPDRCPKESAAEGGLTTADSPAAQESPQENTDHGC